MPIYEYKCENGHVFDVMQKLSDDPLTTCPECGAPVRKVLHPVSIAFKGSGFYSTDYGKKKQPAKEGSGGGSDSSSSSDSGSSSSDSSSKSGDSGSSSPSKPSTETKKAASGD